MVVSLSFPPPRFRPLLLKYDFFRFLKFMISLCLLCFSLCFLILNFMFFFFDFFLVLNFSVFFVLFLNGFWCCFNCFCYFSSLLFVFFLFKAYIISNNA